MAYYINGGTMKSHPQNQNYTHIYYYQNQIVYIYYIYLYTIYIIMFYEPVRGEDKQIKYSPSSLEKLS